MMKTYVRWSANAATARRPPWYSDVLCIHNALETLGDATMELVADTPVPAELSRLDWAGIHEIRTDSASASFLACLDLALTDNDDHDVVYLLEHDYLHAPGALETLAEGCALNPDGYVTLFDDPLYYWAAADTPAPATATRLFAGTSRHWRTVPSTTMTFAAPVWRLAEDRDQFAATVSGTVKPPDFAVWSRLMATGRQLVSCVPSAATHVETTALAPFMDWHGIAATDPAATGPVDPASWSNRLTKITRVAVGEHVPAADRDRLCALGIETEPLAPHRLHNGPPMWLLVAASEKEHLDAAVRDRASTVEGVIVCSTPTQFRGRWFSGRDWFLDDVISAFHTTERTAR